MNDQNNQEDIGCCCPPMTDESDELKKAKPFLIGGIIIYSVLLILDIIYLDNYNLITYLLLIITLSFFTFNRCFMVFQLFTIISIFLIFGTSIPGMGIIIQIGFKNPDLTVNIIFFIIYLFIIVATCFIFYIGFNAYKEMRYLFEQRVSGNPHLIPSYMASNNQGESGNNYDDGNNYNNNSNNNYNNQNQNSHKGFKAFSGKGYTVGGS